MNSETLRRLAAVDMSAESLREVLTIFAEGLAEEEERKAKDAQKSALYRARGGGKISLELRRAVYERDAYKCVYCAGTDNLECDHVIAVSRGGATTLENLATACKSCNSRKRDRDRKFALRHSDDVPQNVRGQKRDIQGHSAEVRGSPAQCAPAHAPEEVLTSLDSISKVSKERPPKGGPKKGFKSQVSEDIQPTEKDRAVAEREGMTPATFRLEWQKWRSHHVSEAKPVANLHQSWVKWASNWVSYGRRQADQPARAGPAKSSSGNGFSVLLDELRAKRNGQQSSTNDPRDITPARVSEPGTGNPGSHLSDPIGKPSGGGEILDFRSASPNSRRSPAPFGEAARTFDWDDPVWRFFDSGAAD